jgi:outer membrane murein-binding lipoprotein Lpp
MSQFKNATYIVLLAMVATMFTLGGCEKQEIKSENSVSTPTTGLNDQQVQLQKDVDAIYNYLGKIGDNWEKRYEYQLPNAFISTGLKNMIQLEMFFTIRHADDRWNAYANSARLLWEKAETCGKYLVVPAHIDFDEMTTRIVNPDGSIGAEQQQNDDQMAYFTVELVNNKYIIHHYNRDGVKETILCDFAKSFSDGDWEAILEKSNSTPENLKWFEYINGGITPKEWIQYLESNQDSESTIETTVQERGTYNRSNATVYAYNNALVCNAAYFAYAQDCANFVSQCLKNGGFVNDNNPNSTSSGSAWFYNTMNTASTSDDISTQTWKTANGLRNYLVVFQSYANNVTAHNGYYGIGVEYGDPLFWDFGSGDGVYNHSQIIYTEECYILNGQQLIRPRICAHTASKQSYPITDYGYNVIVNNNVVKFAHINGTN